MSKFQAILDAKRRTGTAEQGSVQQLPSTKRPGRPPGKRSDPAFEQVTAYIRKETHQQVKIALLQQGRTREFSELIEELLSQWLNLGAASKQ